MTGVPGKRRQERAPGSLKGTAKMVDVEQHAAHMARRAEDILADLDLVRKWAPYGRPVVVGALAHGLLAGPDIDMEVYCPELRIEHGFQVVSECALNPRVTEVRFANHLAGPDKALYWQLRYLESDGTAWKLDIWSAPEDYALPRGEHLVEPLRAALTRETRKAILELKHLRTNDPTVACISIDLYRAVVDDHVRTADELRAWLQSHEIGQLTDWTPARTRSSVACDS